MQGIITKALEHRNKKNNNARRTKNLLLESKGIRLDIYVKDENDTIYNVEMQRGSHKNLPKRLRYYQGNIDLDSISKGEKYESLVKSYI